MARPKIKKPPKLSFEITLGSYLMLLKSAFLYPNSYILQIPQSFGLGRAVGFFVINLCLMYFFAGLWSQLIDLNHPSIFFALSQLVFLIPLLIIGLFLVSGGFFLIAKVLRGKGSFEQTLKIVAYSSIPLIFVRFPLISTLAFLWLIILIVKGFKFIHKYSLLSAMVNVLLPLLLLVLIGIIFGILGSLIMYNFPASSHFQLPFQFSNESSFGTMAN